MDDLTALNRICAAITAGRYKATVEHPGHISVPIPCGRELAFGFANGSFGYSLDFLAGGELEGTNAESETALLVSYALSVIEVACLIPPVN